MRKFGTTVLFRSLGVISSLFSKLVIPYIVNHQQIINKALFVSVE